MQTEQVRHNQLIHSLPVIEVFHDPFYAAYWLRQPLASFHRPSRVRSLTLECSTGPAAAWSVLREHATFLPSTESCHQAFRSPVQTVHSKQRNPGMLLPEKPCKNQRRLPSSIVSRPCSVVRKVPSRTCTRESNPGLRSRLAVHPLHGFIRHSARGHVPDRHAHGLYLSELFPSSEPAYRYPVPVSHAVTWFCMY